MTAWRNFVIEQLKDKGEYPISDDMNFPSSQNLTEAIGSLKESQITLLELISTFPEERLKEKVANKPFSFQSMLHGIVHHDLYHLGQISLLNR